jgi:Glyoxalase-like domain
LELDHVLFAVSDLDAAARELEARHGLASVQGGRHAGWGTANRIVPLGDAYVELITVVDPAEAEASAFGRWVAGGIQARLTTPLGWVARTDELDDVAGRLGLDVSAGSRAGRDGRILSWRLAGVEEAAAEPSLPFFVEWGEGTPLPGRTPVAHPAGAIRLAGLELSGDAARMSAWLGAERLPLTIREGEPAVAAISLATDAGEVVIGQV